MPSVFAFLPKSDPGKQAQKEERERRLEKRRTVNKENEPPRTVGSEMPQHYNDGIEESEPQQDANEESQPPQTYIQSCQDVATQTATSDPLVQQPLQLTGTVVYPMYVPISSRQREYGCDMIQENDEATSYYTGLSSWALFQFLVSYLSVEHPSAKMGKLKVSLPDGLLMVLMRLRLNLQIEDLSYRFGVSLSTVHDIFQKWIEVMFVHLKFLIKWPAQDVARMNMPQLFKDLYPRTRCIIDCSEVFIERPYNYHARAQTYSNYKKHNTVKFLIGITPCGSISFLSKCWGGRATDKHIVQNSGFLRLIEHGDVILADRGFNIAEDLGVYGASLEIPAFTRGKKQLSLREVEYSQRLSKVRIEVERVIGLLKNKYTLLQDTLPITLLKHKTDSEYANIDKILTVCAALVNLCPPIVKCSK